MDLNVPLLRQIQNRIISKPESFEMSSIYSYQYDSVSRMERGEKQEDVIRFCLAGHVLDLSDVSISSPKFNAREAQYLAGLSDQQYHLFFEYRWPKVLDPQNEIDTSPHNKTYQLQAAVLLLECLIQGYLP